MRSLIFAALLAFGAASGPALAKCEGTDLLDPVTGDPGLAAAMEARKTDVPNRQGRFWKVDRWGIPPSYLLGTFHDTEAAERGVTPDMRAAFDSADRLVVEISAEEQASLMLRMATDPDFVFDVTAVPLDERIDPALLPQFSALIGERGLSMEMVRYMRPFVLFSVLGLPVCQIEEMSAGAPMMDDSLMQAASAAQKPVIGLETTDVMLSAFDRITGEDLSALLDDMLRTFVEADEEDLRRTSMNLYLSGETFAIWELSQAMGDQLGGDVALRERAAQVMWEDLLVGRNRNWTSGLLAEIAKGNSFVAVGALHLPGEEGLVEILRRNGWTVTRLDD